MVGDTKHRHTTSQSYGLEGADGVVFNGEGVFKSTDESNDEGGD
jgi:hypothetical protein